MKKNIFGRKFKRDTNERKALFKALMSSLVMKERIQTTEEKAKAIRASIEKLVTKARTSKDKNAFGRQLSVEAIEKLFVSIAPRFLNRPGGYTRIIKLGRRVSDSAALVVMEWVDQGVAIEKVEIKNGKEKSKKPKQLESSVTTGKKTKTKKPLKKREESTEKKGAIARKQTLGGRK